jgi:hypothetical protein
MRYVSFLALTCVIALSVPAASAESALSQYRGVTLGDSVQAVVERLKLTAADVKVLHDGPAPVQQLTWRPRPHLSGSAEVPDSVAELVCTFQAGQLVQIAVIYDRARTQGLTDADLHEALGASYGPSMLVATATQPSGLPVSPRMLIGRWEDPATLLILWREQFPNRVGLTITSIAHEVALKQAIAEGVKLEAEAAPGRERARREAEAAVILTRDEKIRLENKTKFKP